MRIGDPGSRRGGTLLGLVLISAGKPNFEIAANVHETNQERNIWQPAGHGSTKNCDTKGKPGCQSPLFVQPCQVRKIIGIGMMLCVALQMKIGYSSIIGLVNAYQ
jgi:hypothetical protein